MPVAESISLWLFQFNKSVIRNNLCSILSVEMMGVVLIVELAFCLPSGNSLSNMRIWKFEENKNLKEKEVANLTHFS